MAAEAGRGCLAASSEMAGEEVAPFLISLDSAARGEDLEVGLKAAQEFDRLAQAHPGKACFYFAARAHSLLLALYIQKGDKGKAKRELEIALRAVEQSLSAPAESAEAHALRADLLGWKIGLANAFQRMFSGMKYGPQIEKDLQRALELAPNHPRVHLSVGLDYFHKPGMVGGSIKKAVESFRKAVELEPGCVEGWIWLGLALSREEKKGEARKALDQALALEPQNVRARREREGLP